MNYLYVAIGSAVGGVARYALGSWFQQRLNEWNLRSGALSFPIGTLLVNVTGSFLLGVVLIIAAHRDNSTTIRLLFAVGLCGGYTTFSSFSGDTVGLIENGGSGLALLNVVASVALALLATYAGASVGRA